ncbi:unnamed protein product [Nippostrongylus brasiliensis]|uniref:Mitochondrial intermembrane space import and assembly protein 40 n=1 Tax=Nippostrongylus brasiliensis TaxID=27835 RepID=A0A0N4XIC7_NIPBR|nr:unnamed protein product [Nippostrongylus brasiliensis]
MPLLNVPFYAKNAIHRLCSAYITAMDNCSQEPTVQKCPNSPLMLFTESYLKFFCGEYGPAYLGKCRGVSDFFECVEGDLSTECGEISSTLFRRALEDLGCFEATEESKLILLQTNSTKLLTDQYRRDYFASAPKMEITVVTELPRGVDDYPKMPEIAFDEDTRSNTTVASKGEKTTTTPQVAPTDGSELPILQLDG